MLSKEVKYRRRLNRLVRSVPAWRTCMEMMKQQQADILKLQRSGLTGAHAGATPTADRLPDLKGLQDNLAAMRRVQHQRKHMTRQEFFAEMSTVYRTRHLGMRRWAEQIVMGRLDRSEHDRKHNCK